MEAYLGLFFSAFLAATLVPAYSEILFAGLLAGISVLTADAVAGPADGASGYYKAPPMFHPYPDEKAALTSIFDVVGIGGGYVVGVMIFGLSEGAYIDSMIAGVEWNDVAMGLYKSLLFGLVITWICTAKGFFIHRARKEAFGAEGVARITTEAVVLSSIAILFGDYLVGAVML